MVELAAGMQLGHDDFGGAAMEFVVFVNGGGYASAIVADRYAVIGMDGYDYVVAIAGQGFVDGIIDDLEHHVMQASAVGGIPNIHDRATIGRASWWERAGQEG